MATFGLDELKQIVDLAGQELEREDRLIAECFAKNPAYSDRQPEWFPGIMYMKNEAYYQRVATRALLPSFPFRIELEETGTTGRSDIVLYSGSPPECIAVGEMKLVMERNIRADAAVVRPDIEKLQSLTCGRFMVLFALNERQNTEHWIQLLREERGIPPDLQIPRPYTFPTEAHFGKGPELQWEFGVIGLLLKQKETAA